MTIATVEREELQQLIQVLPDKKIPEVLSLVRNFCYEEHVPNEETAAILRDSAEGRNVVGPFNSMNDFMTSLLSDRSLLKLTKYVDELMEEEEEAEDIAYIETHKNDPVVPFDLKDFDAE